MFDDLDLDLPPLDLPVGNPIALMATPTTHLWPIAFIRDLALGLDSEEDVLERHSISKDDYDRIVNHPRFRSEFHSVLTSLQQSGQLFRERARMQAEDYLAKIDNIVNDPNTDYKTVLAAIDKVVGWSGLAAKTQADSNGAAQANVQININL